MKEKKWKVLENFFGMIKGNISAIIKVIKDMNKIDDTPSFTKLF